MNDFFISAGRILLGTFGAATMMAAAPAQAETSDTVEMVTKTDLPSRGSMGAALGSGEAHDEQFRQLFASWDKIDRVQSGGLTTTVSVPSRMPLENARLSSDYGTRIHPVLGRRAGHKGVDLAAPTGTPIYATADGRVSRANWFSSYGKYISIEHGADLQTRFAHLSEIAVSEGASVKKGDLIGYVGSTGRSTGPHLHYEVRVNGVAVDPSPYMLETEAARTFALAGGE